jgi:hypothetical protein
MRFTKTIIKTSGIGIGFFLLTGCFTIPPRDVIQVTYSTVPYNPTSIDVASTPCTTVYQEERSQDIKSKTKYLYSCLNNYSWGRGYREEPIKN